MLGLSLDLGLGSVATMGTNGTPVATVLPVITGTPTTEQTLTVSNGTWTPTPGGYTYQWWRADPLTVGGDPITVGGNIVYLNKQTISGATASTYAVAIANFGYVIGCDVTATFGSKSGTAASEAVGPIAYTDLLAGTGNFASATGWSLSSGFAITGGLLVGVADASTGVATHSATVVASTVRMYFDIKRRTAGTFTPRLSGAPQGLITGTAVSAVADNQFFDFVTTGNTTVNLSKSANFDGDIDNVRLYRIA